MKVRAFRKNHRKSTSYLLSGLAHLVAIMGGSFLISIIAIFFVSGLSWVELSIIPVAIILANFVEYAFHRWPMHSVVKPLKKMYKIHSGKHHRYFTHEYMNIECDEDMREVFATATTVILFISFIVLPVSILSALFISTNVGLLFFATSMMYYGIYEFIHFATHLSLDHWVLKIPFMKSAKSHHQLHHNTKVMRHCNFNIGLPIMDLLFGTYRKETLT